MSRLATIVDGVVDSSGVKGTCKFWQERDAASLALFKPVKLVPNA